MTKKRKNSRAKGSRGERQVAKLFSEWWGSEFTRTPLSGGFATQKFREDWNAAGDLVTPDDSFPFCVECKWVEGWSLDQLLPNKGCLIYKWWGQTLGECPGNKVPLLVFKKNGGPFYCMLPQAVLNAAENRAFPPYGRLVVEGPGTDLVILLLSDLFGIKKDIWLANQQQILLVK